MPRSRIELAVHHLHAYAGFVPAPTHRSDTPVSERVNHLSIVGVDAPADPRRTLAGQRRSPTVAPPTVGPPSPSPIGHLSSHTPIGVLRADALTDSAVAVGPRAGDRYSDSPSLIGEGARAQRVRKNTMGCSGAGPASSARPDLFDGTRIRLPLLCVALACIAGLLACAWLDNDPLIPTAFVLGGVCAFAVSNVWTWSDES